MKTLLALAVLALVVGPALADGDGCCPSARVGGFGCDNMCPLAKEANVHRALGLEAMKVSTVVQKSLAQRVRDNLARI